MLPILQIYRKLQSLKNLTIFDNGLNHASQVWLAIRFKIMTSCTWAFLPRIIVYNRYVWAFIPYTTIYIAYIRVFNTRICAKSNARLYALLKTRIYAYLSKPTYTRAKMCIYTGFRNQTWYKIARKVPLTEYRFHVSWQ